MLFFNGNTGEDKIRGPGANDLGASWIQQLLAQGDDGFLALSEDNVPQIWNQRTLELLEIEESDLQDIHIFLKQVGLTDITVFFQPNKTQNVSLQSNDKKALEIRSLEIRNHPRIHWCLVLRDVSLFAQTVERLHQLEDRYALALENSSDGLWDWDLQEDKIFLSHRWLNMLGYKENDLRNTLADWMNLIHPDDKRLFSSKLKRFLDDKQKERFSLEYRIEDRGGSYRWVKINGMLVFNDEGEAVRFAGSHTDITERKRMESQLIHDSLHDPLTDLPNRLLFRENLQKAIGKRKEGYIGAFAIIQLDIDNFQNINNGLGHMVGDNILTTVARRLQKMVSSNDTVARLAGDEFALLLEAAHTEESILFFARKLQESIGAPIENAGQKIVLSASTGIVLSRSNTDSVTRLLVDSATAVHHARNKGTGQSVLFTEEMHEQAVSRVKLEGDLRKAIDRGEIKVYYQPIYDVTGKNICGFEALARWLYESEKMILPGNFIPVAEETGLILPLGAHILEKACEACVKWNQEAEQDVYVSVNLSARQFREPDIHKTVGDILERTGLPPHLLHVEITESQIMEHALRTVEILRNIKTLDVQISIDDFGTGYSSLAYLKRFPIDIIKIDRAFVRDLPTNPEDVEIANAIIALAHSLKLLITAEGVETSEQMKFLEDSKVEQLQGFLFSPAVPESEVMDWLKNFNADDYRNS